MKELSEVPIYLYWPLCTLLATSVGIFPIVYWFVVRPFDRLLGERSLMLEHGVFFVSALMRSFNYSRNIAFKNKSNWYNDSLYGDFDFKKRSTKTQFVLCYAYLLMTNSMLALMAIVTIYRLF